MSKPFQSQSTATGPIRSAAAVTPHASTPITDGPVRSLFVGVAGDVTCRLDGDSADVLFKNVPSGTFLPVRATHVRATGTTATNILACW